MLRESNLSLEFKVCPTKRTCKNPSAESSYLRLGLLGRRGGIFTQSQLVFRREISGSFLEQGTKICGIWIADQGADFIKHEIRLFDKALRLKYSHTGFKFSALPGKSMLVRPYKTDNYLIFTFGKHGISKVYHALREGVEIFVRLITVFVKIFFRRAYISAVLQNNYAIKPVAVKASFDAKLQDFVLIGRIKNLIYRISYKKLLSAAILLTALRGGAQQ